MQVDHLPPPGCIPNVNLTRPQRRGLLTTLDATERFMAIITPLVSSSFQQVCRTQGDLSPIEPAWRLSRNARVCVLGSCFATELKIQMVHNQLPVTNPSRIAPLLPHQKSHRTDLAYYHPVSVLYELQRALDVYTPPWFSWKCVNGRYAGCWQSPYRRLLLANSDNSLRELCNEVDTQMRTAINDADVWFITSTLLEGWRIIANQHYAAANPGYGGGDGAGHLELHQFNFYDTQRVIMEIARLAKISGKAVIFSVCPVPMGRTYLPTDHLIANFGQKATLRAVIDLACHTYDHVFYFPSYELGLLHPAKLRDNRHVCADCIDAATTLWLEHLQD